MELLREWFIWGESDLFIFGVIIIVIAAFFPLRLEKKRKNRIISRCGLPCNICYV